MSTSLPGSSRSSMITSAASKGVVGRGTSTALAHELNYLAPGSLVRPLRRRGVVERLALTQGGAGGTGRDASRRLCIEGLRLHRLAALVGDTAHRQFHGIVAAGQGDDVAETHI